MVRDVPSPKRMVHTVVTVAVNGAFRSGGMKMLVSLGMVAPSERPIWLEFEPRRVEATTRQNRRAGRGNPGFSWCSLHGTSGLCQISAGSARGFGLAITPIAGAWNNATHLGAAQMSP